MVRSWFFYFFTPPPPLKGNFQMWMHTHFFCSLRERDGEMICLTHGIRWKECTTAGQHVKEEREGGGKVEGERKRERKEGWWGVGCLFVSFFPHSCFVTNPAASQDLTHPFCLIFPSVSRSRGPSWCRLWGGRTMPGRSAPCRDSPASALLVIHI